MKNLISFYKDKEAVDEKIKANTLALSRCEFRKNEILTKGSIALALGLVLSLIVCPQFGFGVPNGHGISHVFWVISPGLCALFCGVFLYLCGVLTLGVALNRHERLWFFHKTKGAALFLPGLLWSVFMMMPKTSYVSVSYSLLWFVGFCLLMPLSKLMVKRMALTSS